MRRRRDTEWRLHVRRVHLRFPERRARLHTPAADRGETLCQGQAARSPAAAVLDGAHLRLGGHRPSKAAPGEEGGEAVEALDAPAHCPREQQAETGQRRARPSLRAEHGRGSVPGQSRRRTPGAHDDRRADGHGPGQRLDGKLPQLSAGVGYGPAHVPHGLRGEHEPLVPGGPAEHRSGEWPDVRTAAPAPEPGHRRVPLQPVRQPEAHRRDRERPDRSDRREPAPAVGRVPLHAEPALPALLGERHRQGRDLRQRSAAGPGVPDRGDRPNNATSRLFDDASGARRRGVNETYRHRGAGLLSQSSRLPMGLSGARAPRLGPSPSSFRSPRGRRR